MNGLHAIFVHYIHQREDFFHKIISVVFDIPVEQRSSLLSSICIKRPFQGVFLFY